MLEGLDSGGVSEAEKQNDEQDERLEQRALHREEGRHKGNHDLAEADDDLPEVGSRVVPVEEEAELPLHLGLLQAMAVSSRQQVPGEGDPKRPDQQAQQAAAHSNREMVASPALL